MRDYLDAIDALLMRRDTLESTIEELVSGSSWADTIARLRCLPGIDTLSAVGLCAETGDWKHFPKAGHEMSYLCPPNAVPHAAQHSGRPLPATRWLAIRHATRLTQALSLCRHHLPRPLSRSSREGPQRVFTLSYVRRQPPSPPVARQ